MSDNICPSAEKCPIFSGILKGKDYTTKSYKAKYCEAGVEGRNSCKRFQCKQKFGKVPDTLLPNTYKTLDEIQRESNL
ncbi:MAG TPA: hypothetical protein PK385_02350 [Spirochaetota bacterium]|jgi:hypothetical protein|nr:MAG: hypothetical protein BWX91_02485 [Spirochaetes bacterium ADurb.Bin133]HNZ27239.1 hypothetical protein [Spirochaetota bacterium]HOF00190.1 hypothetical protein [Spirochaetota bacterium]HOS32955.1 hypothetical protein [Spirochaetota bacterium]HOS54879.1 hypothetical protein [Spirochaetota bacterium]